MSTIGTSFLVLGLLTTLPSGEPPQPDAKKEPKAEKKIRGKFTISKETTCVTGPVDLEGYIDYAAALNERLGKGATPANNAAVLIWKALGPHPEGAKMPAEFFKLLGIEAPPENGDYFIDLSRYVKEHLKLEQGQPTNDFFDQLTRGTQHPWTEKENPGLASWLKANEKPLVVAVEATKRSHYFSPLVPPRTPKGSAGLIGALLPAVQKCRELANALVARAMLRLAQGKDEDAWQDLLACHRLGRLVGRGATLIESLVGIAIDAIASKADLVFLDRAKPAAKRIQTCLRDLQGLPPLPVVADKVDLAERFVLLDSIMLIDRHGIKYLEGLSKGDPKDANPFAEGVLEGIDWDPALQTANQWYDRLVAAMREKDRASRKKKLDEVITDLKALRTSVTNAGGLAKLLLGGDKARGKALGDVLVTLLIPAVQKVQDAADRAGQVQDNLQVAFALAWYQRDHGSYPKELDALAPKYLGKVPQDRFSGKALIYRPEKDSYLLYSVGINGIDEEGRGYEDDPPGDDLSVRMPLPEVRRK